MILLSHPTSNQNHRHLAAALANRGLLAEAWTGFAWRAPGWVDACLPRVVVAELNRRRFPAEVAARVRTTQWREGGRLLAERMGWGRATRHETGWFSVDAVYYALDRRVAARLRRAPDGIRAVYAYEGGALASFQAAGELGLKRMYELPIGYWRAARTLYDEEAERLPEWAPTLSGIGDSPGKCARKDAELLAADFVSVASTFTLETLRQSPLPSTTPVAVTAYGSPARVSEAVVAERLQRTGECRPLRALFVGGLSQRKGLAEVFAAWRQLKPHVELTVIGKMVGTCRGAGRCPVLEQELAACRYIGSLPHAGVLAEMRAHDVLLFPSLFEGLGLVILEAMSQGLPVITTGNTGGRDVITPGVDGMLVPIRDATALAAAILQLERDRGLLAAMSEAAWQRAGDFTWDRYGETIVTRLQSVLETSK